VPLNFAYRVFKIQLSYLGGSKYINVHFLENVER
jgi:hypothetical protein